MMNSLKMQKKMDDVDKKKHFLTLQLLSSATLSLVPIFRPFVVVKHLLNCPSA